VGVAVVAKGAAPASARQATDDAAGHRRGRGVRAARSFQRKRPSCYSGTVPGSSWKPPPSHRIVPADETESFASGADGTRLYVRRRPGPRGVDAPTVLFCDGVLCDGFIWKYLWGDLASVGPVAHWHYRGHGRSGAPADPERTEVEDFAGDLDRVRRHLGDPPVVLVGHSFGVQVALEGYRLRPDLVAGLVLCCGAPGKVTETFHGTNVLAQWLPKVMKWVTEYPELARAIWTRVPTDLSLKISYLTGEVDKSNMRREDLVPYLKHMTTVDFGLFVRILRSAGEHSAEDLLPQIGAPSLIVAAERDTFTPPDLALKMSQAILGGELLVLKNGSHAGVIEQPDLMRTRVVQFLRDRVGPFVAEHAS
jgi:pimeloyl-ACP methyl ester carboxylesterase